MRQVGTREEQWHFRSQYSTGWENSYNMFSYFSRGKLQRFVQFSWNSTTVSDLELTRKFLNGICNNNSNNSCISIIWAINIIFFILRMSTLPLFKKLCAARRQIYQHKWEYDKKDDVPEEVTLGKFSH